MVDDADQNTEPEWLRNLPLRAEEIGFEPGELVTCADCGKLNAPNRGACLYCGAKRKDIPEDQKLEIRELEDWENGFNVVLLNADKADIEKAADAIGAITSSEREYLIAVFQSGKNIPILRAASDDAARLVSRKLDELGISTAIIEDSSLRSASVPVRLRSIEFEDDHFRLRLFNLDEVCTIPTGELTLIVTGTIFEERHESVERRKGKSTKLLNETATASDEPVIDIYSKTDPRGWRIPARGFDFSCLGGDKSLVVAGNMKRLIAKLADTAPNARVMDDYTELRSLLEVPWPSEVKREAKIVAAGKKDFSTVFITSNATQFTKFSRLQGRLVYEEKV